MRADSRRWWRCLEDKKWRSGGHHDGYVSSIISCMTGLRACLKLLLETEMMVRKCCPVMKCFAGWGMHIEILFCAIVLYCSVQVRAVAKESLIQYQRGR